MMDYEALALSRLTSFFEGKPRVREVVGSLPVQLTILESVADQVKNERSIDTAIGIQLDKVGAIVGERRLGRLDEEYRRAIRLRTFINTSKGRPSDLIFAVKESTQASNVQYFESYPATVLLHTNGYEANKELQKTIQDVSPAAIFDVPISVSFGAKPFRLIGTSSGSSKLGAWTTLNQKRMKTLSGKIILLREKTLEEYGLGGIQLGVFTTLTHKRLLTLSGKKIRMRQNRQVIPSIEKLTGVYQA